LLERLERLRHEPALQPVAIALAGDTETLRRKRGNAPAVADRPRRLADRVRAGAEVVEQALAGLRHERIEADELAHPVASAYCHAADDQPGVGVADENHVAELLGLEHPDDVLHVSLEVDLGTGEVGTLAEPRQRRGVHLVRGVTEQPRDTEPAPPTVPCAVNENEARHPRSMARGPGHAELLDAGLETSGRDADGDG